MQDILNNNLLIQEFTFLMAAFIFMCIMPKPIKGSDNNLISGICKWNVTNTQFTACTPVRRNCFKS